MPRPAGGKVQLPQDGSLSAHGKRPRPTHFCLRQHTNPLPRAAPHHPPARASLPPPVPPQPRHFSPRPPEPAPTEFAAAQSPRAPQPACAHIVPHPQNGARACRYSPAQPPHRKIASQAPAPACIPAPRRQTYFAARRVLRHKDEVRLLSAEESPLAGRRPEPPPASPSQLSARV